jgi:hypothetical protein
MGPRRGVCRAMAPCPSPWHKQLTGQCYTGDRTRGAVHTVLAYMATVESIQSYTFYSSVLPGLSKLPPMLIARIISDRNGLSVVCFEQNGWPRQPGSRGAHALMCVSVRLHHVCPRPCHPYDYMSALFSALLAGASRSR